MKNEQLRPYRQRHLVYAISETHLAQYSAELETISEGPPPESNFEVGNRQLESHNVTAELPIEVGDITSRENFSQKR